MSSHNSYHRHDTNTQHQPPHGRDVFASHWNCRCRKCLSYRDAVHRLVEGFSQIPGRWIADLAECFEPGLVLPMWGTLFIPDDSADFRSIERLLVELPADDDSELAALGASGWRQVADTGVLACEFDGELLLGIHGAGYDFYSHHWEPLYAALGYRWHE
jgi:hypothetical protein